MGYALTLILTPTLTPTQPHLTGRRLLSHHEVCPHPQAASDTDLVTRDAWLDALELPDLSDAAQRALAAPPTLTLTLNLTLTLT